MAICRFQMRPAWAFPWMKRRLQSTGWIPQSRRPRTATWPKSGFSACTGRVTAKSESGNLPRKTAISGPSMPATFPGFEQGVDLEVIEDDNSAAFQKRHEELVAQGR